MGEHGLYRLLIVDDDKEVRDGLAEIVDWRVCGFEVVAALSDGEEGISYLEKHPVDVVLSDVMMTFVSGLELARHVYERQLPVKVVLISGYQEFGLAKEAMRYNVHDYLLKPTDLDEVYEVFKAMRHQLDQERQEDRKQARRQALWNQTTQYLKMSHLPHMLKQSRLTVEALRQAFEMIGLALEPEACSCTLVRIGWNGEQQPAAIMKGLMRSLPDKERDLVLLPYDESNNPICILAVHSGEDAEVMGREMSELLTHAAQRLRGLFVVELMWRQEMTYGSLLTCLQTESAAASGQLPITVPLPEGVDNGMFRFIQDGKQQWQEWVRQGKHEAAEHWLEQITSHQAMATVEILKPLLIELFGSLDTIYATESGSAGLLALCRANEADELRMLSRKLLGEISRQLSEQGTDSERNVITQVKTHIRDCDGKDVTLSEIAERVYLNPVYLSRLFKRETGQSFSDYVTEIRLEQAARLLRRTNMKIYEISEHAGYRDVRHFYKLFKKYSGHSPTDYRELKLHGMPVQSKNAGTSDNGGKALEINPDDLELHTQL